MGTGRRCVFIPVGLFLLSTIPLPSEGIRGHKPCNLPESWSGKWFEYGERDAVGIDGKNVTHKGTCIANLRDKYIFKDPILQCYRCSVMHQKHPNVLQYKESLCESSPGRRDQFEICYGITADSPLKSLYRLDAKPSSCPIQGSFQFSYSRGHGVCDYPKSSISQCSDASKLVFRYQACADIKGSESSVESVECIAEWKEGSTYYFLGLISRDHVSQYDYEDRFRCFAYQSIFQGFLISQSGDAQCTLHSAKEGDKTMTLKKVHEQQCSLPHWILQHHHTFHNLDHSDKYHFNTLGTSLTITSEESVKKLKCNTIESDTGNYTKIIMQVKYECESGFMCMEVYRKADSIMSLKLGKLSRNPEEACNQHLFFDTAIPSVIIVSAKMGHRVRCPLVGKYAMINNQQQLLSATSNPMNTELNHLQDSCLPGRHYHDHLMFGCTGEGTEFTLVQQDCARTPGTLTSGYICHGGWREPLPSQNTFSKVQAAASIVAASTSSSSDVMASRQDQQNPLEGGGSAPTVSGQHYVVISSAKNPRKRFCVRLIMDEDNSNVSLLAHSENCPLRPQNDGINLNWGSNTWSFNLTRQSECAQALATANRGNNPPQCIFRSAESISLLSITLLFIFY